MAFPFNWVVSSRLIITRDTSMTSFKSISCLLALAVALSCGQAVGQTYSNVSGSDFDYTDIVETSGGGLFGQPTVEGADLIFPTTGFSAEGVDGALDFLNGMLELEVSSNSGQAFSQISLDEFGVYFNTGDSISTVEGFLTVQTDDGLFTDSFSFEFGAGSGTWIGNATVNFPATLQADVFVHNILLADSVPDEVGSINKRDIQLTVGVPEPSICGLMLIGLCGMATRRRR